MGEKKKVIVVAAIIAATVVIVATAVVVAVVEVQVGLVRWPTCWKRGLHSSFSSSGPAQPFLGRASSCSDPSRIRPLSLQKHK